MSNPSGGFRISHTHCHDAATCSAQFRLWGCSDESSSSGDFHGAKHLCRLFRGPAHDIGVISRKLRPLGRHYIEILVSRVSRQKITSPQKRKFPA